MAIEILSREANDFAEELFTSFSKGDCPVTETLVAMEAHVKKFVMRTLIYEVCLAHYGVTDINQLLTAYQLKYKIKEEKESSRLDTGSNPVLAQIYTNALPAVKYKLMLAQMEIFEDGKKPAYIDRTVVVYALMFLTITKQIVLGVDVLTAFIKGEYFIFEYAVERRLFFTTPMDIRKCAGSLSSRDILKYFSVAVERKKDVNKRGYGLSVAYKLNPDLSSWGQGYYCWGHGLHTIKQKPRTDDTASYYVVDTELPCQRYWVLRITSGKPRKTTIGLDVKGRVVVSPLSPAWITLTGGKMIAIDPHCVTHQIEVFSTIL